MDCNFCYLWLWGICRNPQSRHYQKETSSTDGCDQCAVMSFPKVQTEWLKELPNMKWY